jgi:ABC-type uncharacterized transport system ATPase subunit
VSVEAVLAEPATRTEVLLTVEHLVKRFGSLTAIDDVSFTVRAGEVHALLGENGAGKSTLVKTLYGVHPPDGGLILVGGEPVDIPSPAAARDLGLGMVFQDLRLVPALTVWENVALHARERGFRLKPRAVQARLAEESKRYGLDVDPKARVSDLSIGEWQRVELLKVLLAGARVLILDEPTSVLTPQEVDGLFGVVRRLRAEGVGIVIINHKMREVREIADRITVLRGGRAIVTDVACADIGDDELVTAMVGESVTPVHNDEATAEGELSPPVLVGRDLQLAPIGDGSGLQGVDLRVAAGEILGIAGVAGNGQQELTDLLTGTANGGSGEVIVDGIALPMGRPKAFHAAGVVPVVSDPVQQFVVPGLTVAEHAALWRSSAGGKALKFDVKAARRQLAEASDRVSLRVAAPDRRLADLSGGNIQRVLLALALGEPSKVLVVSYPTRGLDVRTTEVTRSLLLAAREAGTAVVLVSEDLDELLALSDRIAVLAKGRIAGVVASATTDRQQLGQLMTGSVR